MKALTDKINCLESESGGKGSKGEKGGRQYTERQAGAASPETMMEELERPEDGAMTITAGRVDLI